MPIQNYPRFLTKASKTAQQLQSGLPIVGSDGVTGDFNALKVNTDGSINVAGGGGGDATASNQVTQINLATTGNSRLTSIQTNTGASTTGGFILSNLLQKVQKYSQWNTFASVNFNCGAGGNIFSLVKFSGQHAVRIVFHSDNVTINAINNRLSTDVTSDYFDYTTANAIANRNTEIISIGNTTDDLFSTIDINNACHFTAYYLINPYINP